jgi:hypothetical protein
MKAIDFESFAAERGAYPDWGDCGMHKTSDHVSRTAKLRALKREIERGKSLQEHREAWRAEYEKLVAAGEIRPLTAIERLERNAAGHPDNQSTQAAIRALEKRGIR